MRRKLLLLNSAVRLAYGIVVLLRPSGSAKTPVPLAPDTDELPEARLFVRGFAAHQIAVAAVGIASLSTPKLESAAIALAATIDASDVATTLIEGVARGKFDEDVLGGILFSSAGVATAIGAWQAADSPVSS